MSTLQNPSKATHIGNLLVHLPNYGIVICKECAFAIQPNAVSGHLLGHQVYRDHRQRILAQVARLNVLKADQVSRPIAGLAPIPYITIAHGYRCNVCDGAYLCISQKRMSLHLSESHDLKSIANFDENTQPTHLQTIFRGNKLSYFEVKPGSTHAQTFNREKPSQDPFANMICQNDQSTGGPLLNAKSQTSINEGISKLPMQDLLYLHHYTVNTGLSLTRGTESTNFWTQQIPLEASSQPFLMYGILGVAAFHKALLATNDDERQLHSSAGLRYQSAGLSIFRSMVDSPTFETSTALTAFSRLIGVQINAQNLTETSPIATTVESVGLSRVLRYILMIRGGLDMLLNLQPLLPPASPLIQSTDVLQNVDSLEKTAQALKPSVAFLINYFRDHANVTTRATLGDMTVSPNKLGDVHHLIDICRRISQDANSDCMTTNAVTKSASDVLLCNNSDTLALMVTKLQEIVASHRCQIGSISGLRSSSPMSPQLPYISSAVYIVLTALPSKLMASRRSLDPVDLEVLEEVIAALISSSSQIYGSSCTWVRWNAIEFWARMLPQRFINMIESADPLALAITVQWCVLLSSQESQYWFLAGQSLKLIDTILANLDDPAQSFVRDCILPLGEFYAPVEKVFPHHG